jgi:hypothetical protein
LNLGNGSTSVQPVYPLTGADTVTCRITANQIGNTQFLSAVAVSQTLKISKQTTKTEYRFSSPTVTEAGTFLFANVTTTVGRLTGTTTMVSMSSLTPLTCTVSDLAVYDSSNGPRGTVRAKTNGVCSIKIDYPGNADQFPSTNTWTTTISGISAVPIGSNTAQTISFPAIADRSYNKSAPLLATASSKLPVKYTSITPDTCFVIEALASGPAVQSAKESGADTAVCTIQANQAGDDRFAPAPLARVSFIYAKAPMRITATSAPITMRGAGPYIFTTSVLHTDIAMNSGLSSLGHLLTVTSNSPTICMVESNKIVDRRGGLFNQTLVRALNNGNCSLQFYFPGTATRAASTLIWNGVATGFVIPTSTYIELQFLQKALPATGSAMSLKAIDGGRLNLNAFIKTPDPKLMGSATSIQSMVRVATATPTICNVEQITFHTSSSSPYTGSVIRPLKVGLCTINYSFAGNTSMKQEASSFSWSAQVS